jgi:hypothetical protein
MFRSRWRNQKISGHRKKIPGHRDMNAEAEQEVWSRGAVAFRAERLE